MDVRVEATGAVQSAPRKLAGNMGPIGLALTVLAFSAPLTTVSGYIPLALMFGGVASPLIFIAATLILLLFSVCYVTLNSIVKRPGDFYAFISYCIGKQTGLGAGVLAAVSYLLILSGVTSFFGVACSDFLHRTTGTSLEWYWSAFGCWLVVGILGYLHVELSAKVLTWVMFAEVAVCLTFSVGVLAKGGDPGIAAIAPFTPGELSHSANIPLSMLFIVSFFMGFEATALFRDEVRLPDRTIPIATYGAVIFIGAIYTLCAYAMILSYGTHVQEIAAESPGSMFIGAFSRYVDGRALTLISIMVLISSFASSLSVQNVLARYLHNLGSDGALPRYLGKVHPRHESPHLASVTVSFVVLCILLPLIARGASPALLYGQLSSVGTSGIIILMTVVNVASLIWYVRRGRNEGTTFMRSFMSPLISSAFFIALVYLVATHFDVLAGGAPGQFTWMFYGLIGVQFAGMVLAQYFKLYHPDIFSNLGRSHSS